MRGGGRGLFLPALAVTVCLLAAGFDAATSRIPNPITYPAVVFGLAINLAASLAHAAGHDAPARLLGSEGIVQSLFGFCLCAGIGLASVLLAGMGGGDMKLLAAVGAILGLAKTGPALILALAVAVVYSLVNLVIFGRLNAVLRAIAAQVLEIVYLKQVVPATVASKRNIPLAVPLLVGLLLSRVITHERFPEWMPV